VWSESNAQAEITLIQIILKPALFQTFFRPGHIWFGHFFPPVYQLWRQTLGMIRMTPYRLVLRLFWARGQPALSSLSEREKSLLGIWWIKRLAGSSFCLCCHLKSRNKVPEWSGVCAPSQKLVLGQQYVIFRPENWLGLSQSLSGVNQINSFADRLSKQWGCKQPHCCGCLCYFGKFFCCL
jgi:hypothetical protein